MEIRSDSTRAPDSTSSQGAFVTLDTESCGFTGPVTLIQWAEGLDGEVKLFSPERESIRDTLALVEFIISRPVLGFNLAHDVFKLCQTWTTLKVLGHRVGYDQKPIDHVDEHALCEPLAFDGPCLKPASALDLMLFARRGPWQALMARDPIIVRRVPVALAEHVRASLESKIKIPDIFFAKSKKRGGHRWKIKPIKRPDGDDPDFVNIELKFNPSSGLKALATQELGLDPLETLVFSDVEVERAFLPKENKFAPFALSVGKPGEWNGAWPDVIKYHDSHWAYNPLARKYAALDVEYPRKLWTKWGCPEFGDRDSLLACKSGAMRWKGFAVNLKGIQAFKVPAVKKAASAPLDFRKIRPFVEEFLSPEERTILIDPKSGNVTTKKVVLEEVAKLKECTACLEGRDHAECKPFERTHRAALRARMCLDAKKAKKRVEVFDKLLSAMRFFVSTNVIGTRSSRQSGGTVSEGKAGRKSGSLNPQAINKDKKMRAQFPLAWTPGLAGCQNLTEAFALWAELGFPVAPERLVGGDFDKFEVCIADSYYSDPQLHEDLIGIEPSCDYGECDGKCSKCSGKPAKKGSIKIHAVVGTLVYPGRTYWEIRATDGKDREWLSQKFPKWPEEHWKDLYTRAKSAFFALIYFGNEHTLAERLGIPVEDGRVAYAQIMARYPVMAEKREEFFERFCALRQPDGIGSRVFWVEPDETVSSMLGFERWFTWENKVIRALFELADDVPDEWRAIKIKVRRRDREQTAANAARSAILAAAFGLQSANMRAAGNHVIQSTGAELTKELEGEIWELQPCGIHSWRVRPMNVHDELPTAATSTDDTTAIVADRQKKFVARRQSLIPLLAMKWKNMYNWSGK